MKITILPFQKKWADDFDKIAAYILPFLKELKPVIAHIGSTSVQGLSAKPIIDIMIGLSSEADLDKCIAPMQNAGAVYYEQYNEIMPYRRFFTFSKAIFGKGDMAFDFENKVINSTNALDNILANVHILTYNSLHWKRHIAFRNYLRENDVIRAAYQDLKIKLSGEEFENVMAYNQAKDAFIKHYEALAMQIL